MRGSLNLSVPVEELNKRTTTKPPSTATLFIILVSTFHRELEL